MRTNKIKRILLSTFGLFAIVLIIHIVLSVIVPLAQGNGINNFSGIKRQVAQEAYDDTRANIDNKIRWSYAIHIDAVYPTTAAEKALHCGSDNQRAVITNDNENVRYYTATITVRDLFGYRSIVGTGYGCASFPGGFTDPNLGPEPN